MASSHTNSAARLYHRLVCTLLIAISAYTVSAQRHVNISIAGDTVKFKDRSILLIKNNSRFLNFGECYVTTLDGTPLVKLSFDTVFVNGLGKMPYMSVQVDEPKITLYRPTYNGVIFHTLDDLACNFLFDEDRFDADGLKQLFKTGAYINDAQFEVCKTLSPDSIRYTNVTGNKMDIMVRGAKIGECRFVGWLQRRSTFYWDNKRLSSIHPGDYYYFFDLSGKKIGELGFSHGRQDYDIATVAGSRFYIINNYRWKRRLDITMMSAAVKVLALNTLYDLSRQ